jgi:hypothetical protein
MSYDPTVGRWTIEDPIAFEGGDVNLYRYVGNSPANATDPTGLAEEPVQGMTPSHNRPRPIRPPAPQPAPPSSCTPAMILPGNPTGLPPEWTPDPTHKYPNGTRFRHPGGDYVDWHPGQPGKPGWGGKDHWHHNGGKQHLKPGDEIPDPNPVEPPAAPDLPQPDPNTKYVVIGVGAGCVIYWIVSEGSRFLFPPRNLIPIP